MCSSTVEHQNRTRRINHHNWPECMLDNQCVQRHSVPKKPDLRIGFSCFCKERERERERERDRKKKREKKKKRGKKIEHKINVFVGFRRKLKKL